MDFKRGTITLTTRKTKDGSARRDTLDMSDELHQTLWIWKNSQHRHFKKSPYVFVCQRQGRNYGKPFTTRRTFMESLCKRAEVKAFGCHALRHHVASYLADKGISTPEIQALLRHQSTTTTDRYIGRLRKGNKHTVDLLRTDENLLPDLLPQKKEGQP
ncbi:hypothetical protein FAK_32600 [Desulfoferula mesophila]|uniref:Tyr recombinase domain-containing protein n=1 Tax=Desulfoferula mesophila TaxID=3058419 RepID=A0AAU9ESS3_9BACT|nr:hypothetical protein FAK_32600 [Desulfoferula mesophilus]